MFRKTSAILITLAFSLGFAVPAASGSTEWTAYQKTLATYSGSQTALSSFQKSQIRATLEKTPDSEKFICTGIRYYDQPMSVNIMVRKRAKEACAYAKQLKPELSTWFQNKPTKARSYAGKVLLTVKSPKGPMDIQDYRSWDQVESPSSVDECKIEDGLDPQLLRQGRGSWYNGQKARGPVGFPFVSSTFFPNEGELKFLMMLVSFEDTKKFVDKPKDYWNPQNEKLADWFDYWSRGKMSLDINTVEPWIDLPYASSKAPIRDEQLAKDVIERLPSTIDVSDYDGLFIQWAPGIKVGTRSKFKLSLNSIDSSVGGRIAPQFEYSQLVWSTSLDFHKNEYEVRRDHLWGSLVHELLHEMNMNLHGPGNGWGTGVGQSYRANQMGGVSYAITAWEQFLLEWMPDSQVHCVTPQDLVEAQSVILTPLEISGGDRKALVIPISNSDVLVIESRRPVGYSESWNDKNKGLLAYTVNPQEAAQMDHIDQDCGNDPTYTKWAYYLFPDQEMQEASGWCGAMGGVFTPAIFNEGETLTHNGVHVELVKSAGNKDYVKITKAEESFTPPAIYLGPKASNGGWWNQCDGGECPLELPNPAENFGWIQDTADRAIPKLNSCDGLYNRGFRNGVAASRAFRDDAGAAVASLVSTQWYAKNRHLDTNLDGVICSCQAPEEPDSSKAGNDSMSKCMTLQADQSFDPPASVSSASDIGRGSSDYPFSHMLSRSSDEIIVTRYPRWGPSCSCCG